MRDMDAFLDDFETFLSSTLLPFDSSSCRKSFSEHLHTTTPEARFHYNQRQSLLEQEDSQSIRPTENQTKTKFSTA